MAGGRRWERVRTESEAGAPPRARDDEPAPPLRRRAFDGLSFLLILFGASGLVYLWLTPVEPPRQERSRHVVHAEGSRVSRPGAERVAVPQPSLEEFDGPAGHMGAALLHASASAPRGSATAPQASSPLRPWPSSSPPPAKVLAAVASPASPVEAQSPCPPPPSPSPQPTPMSPHDPAPAPALPPPALNLHWASHPATNCWWDGHGSESELESPQGSAAPGISSLEACKAACYALFPTCGGVLFNKNQAHCYRKGKIDVPNCQHDANLDLYVLEAPSPPFPPKAPPSPPRPPVGRGIAALNEQFRKGHPSQLLNEGAFINGRISTMIIYKDLSKRPDRQSVPLPFGNRGGVILHPSFVKLDCAYGIDGATYHLDNPAHPGCSDKFCDPNNIFDQNGNVWCGFNGAPAMAWSPRDLKKLLETHAQHGVPWHGPGFHSGYNEAIINSKTYNDNLPHSVAGFFVPKGQSTVTGELGYGIIIDVVQVHRDFLAQHGLTKDEVPLVEFDPFNWDEPFSLYNA